MSQNVRSISSAKLTATKAVKRRNRVIGIIKIDPIVLHQIYPICFMRSKGCYVKIGFRNYEIDSCYVMPLSEWPKEEAHTQVSSSMAFTGRLVKNATCQMQPKTVPSFSKHNELHVCTEVNETRPINSTVTHLCRGLLHCKAAVYKLNFKTVLCATEKLKRAFRHQMRQVLHLKNNTLADNHLVTTVNRRITKCHYFFS